MNNAIRLERERRRSANQDRLWSLLQNPAIVDQVAALGGMATCYYLGKSRMVNRDLGGFLFGMSATISAARAGVHDKYSLLGIWASAVAVYALAVPPTESEAILSFDLSTPLGSDDKLFGLPKVVGGAIFPPAGLWYSIEDMRAAMRRGDLGE